MSLCAINVYINADDISTNFMLMNNYDVRQNQDIWNRMRQGFQLNHEETTRVKYYERFYSKSQTHFDKLIKNASPYIYYILTQTERNGLPSELALIPIVESDYNPFTINGAGSYDGMWQFTPSTGTGFNLNENSNINERKNIVKSTNAALNYLTFLNEMFKQWDVAIGAYNWGPGNMGKAITASNQKIGNINYSDLPLRKITADYVPKVIALSNIIANPSKFGLRLDSMPNQPYFAIIHPVNNDTVSSITDKSNTDSQTFKILNPQFKNTDYAPQQQAQILVPIKNQEIYLASINGNKIITPQVIVPTTQATTTIASNTPNTAGNNNVAPFDDAINQIGYADNGQNVKVAIVQGNSTTTTDNDATVPVSNGNYIKVANVTQEDVSQEDVTPETSSSKPILIIPRMANNKTNSQLNSLVDNLSDDSVTKTTSKPHVVKARNTQEVTKHKIIKYKVNKGDTLYSIAKKFNVEISDIRRMNKLHGNSVQYKQILKIATNTSGNSTI